MAGPASRAWPPPGWWPRRREQPLTWVSNGYKRLDSCKGASAGRGRESRGGALERRLLLLFPEAC